MKTAYEHVLAYLNAPDSEASTDHLKKMDSLDIEFNSKTPVGSIDELVPRSFDMSQHVPLSEVEKNQVYVIFSDNIPKNTKYIWKTSDDDIFFSSAEPTNKDINCWRYKPGSSLVIGPKDSVSETYKEKVTFIMNDTNIAMYFTEE